MEIRLPFTRFLEFHMVTRIQSSAARQSGNFWQMVNGTYRSRGGGGTPIHYLYGYVPPNGVVILKLLIQNGVSISEAFSRTGYNISNARNSSSFVSSHFKFFKDRLLLKIRFNALTSKLLYSYCTLERSIKNWLISRTGYQFQGEFQNGVSILGKIFFRTGCQFGVSGGTYPPKKYPSAPPGTYTKRFQQFCINYNNRDLLHYLPTRKQLIN